MGQYSKDTVQVVHIVETGKSHLTPERIQSLEELDFEWEKQKAEEDFKLYVEFAAFLRYFSEVRALFPNNERLKDMHNAMTFNGQMNGRSLGNKRIEAATQSLTTICEEDRQ